MKRLASFILLVGFLSIALYVNAFSQIGFGFVAGLSTPNDKINDIYNSDKLNLNNQDLLGKLYRNGVDAGYHIGLKLRLPLSDNLLFTGSILWNRFPQSQINVNDPNNPDSTIATLQVTENIIPIAVGINFYVLRSFIRVYGTGELTYGFISSTVDYKSFVSIPLTAIGTSQSDSRVGFGIGAGMDLDIKLLLLNLEAKYNIANLIGKVGGENTKSYFTLSLGVYFGSSSTK